MIASSEPVADEMFRLLVDSVRDYAIFLLTPEGRVATWNSGARLIKGYDGHEIIGSHISRFYPKELIDRDWPNTELRLAKEHGRLEDEGWRVRKDGSRFWANVVITALHGPDGQLKGYAKVTRDLTERLRHEESLRRSEQRLQLLIDSVSEHAIFMLDTEGRVAGWNSGAERLKGYTPREILGQHFSKFYLPEAVARGWPQHEIKVATETGRFEDEGWRVRKDGTRFWANVVITAVYDEGRNLVGFAKVTRDLTQRSALTSMQDSEKHMDEFIAMLGHELRNPLGALSNAATIVKKGGAPELMGRASDMLQRQVRQLARLV
ncbi:MAG TPA: PAS domain S-box protein, partial [Steroidobacteraceae bacterium]|nr:PAS domain S-box protein [Steroidobacteraceae bacterium]